MTKKRIANPRGARGGKDGGTRARPGKAWLAIADLFQALAGERLLELQTLAGKQRVTMRWAEDKLRKALRVRYTRSQLVSIINCVAHALSDSPKTGNPRLRET